MTTWLQSISTLGSVVIPAVTLSVYTLTGQRVATLLSGHQQPGHYEVTWDGSGLANGVCLYRLEAGEFVKTRKMVLVK